MLRSLALIAALLTCHFIVAQEVNNEQISAAFGKGDAKGVAAHFASSLDLMIDKVEEVYSKEQAEMILSRFFSDHPPLEFQLMHQGRSKQNDHYYIGDMKADKASFRVTYFIKNEEGGGRIRQLRIEPK